MRILILLGKFEGGEDLVYLIFFALLKFYNFIISYLSIVNPASKFYPHICELAQQIATAKA
ncbi:hypothetical protein CO101_02325, partial [Candidatus Berkelbacteria bacterium CG_4_9_14_3_um_filter_39_23]